MYSIENVFTYAFSLGTNADNFQTVTAAAASTNIIDLDSANIKLGAGKPMYIIARIGSVDWATIVSLEIRLQTDTAEAFGTADKDYILGRWALAQLTAGSLLLNIPMPVMQYQRYLRLYFAVFTSNTAGTIFAALADSPEEHALQVDHVEAAS